MLSCRVTAVTTGLQKLLRSRGYSYVTLPGYSSYGVAEVTEVTGLQLCYVAGLQQLLGCRSY